MNCNEKFNSDIWQCPACTFSPEVINGYPSFSPELMKVTGGFDPILFEKLFRLESGHFWFRSRNKLILWAIQEYFPQAKTFFEVGCGTGYVLNGISDNTMLTLYGSDVFPEALLYAQERVKKACFLQMDACRIPFENEFDIIGAFDVIEHIDDDSSALTSMHKALKREGGLILTVPQHPLLWTTFDKYSHHARRYVADELKKMLTKVGFKVVRQTSYVSLLFPLLMLSRVKARVNDLEQELKVGRRINSILERVMDAERALIRSGLDLPFGGSLLMISRKI